MGIYSSQLLPRLIDVACGTKDTRPIRDKACRGLRGRVVEIGFGSGHNIVFYGSEVEQVSAVEPSDVAWNLASKRIADSPVPIERAGLDGQKLPFADASFDCALSTWTMCTIPDVASALLELRRVLKPDGALHFAEHGHAPDEGVQRWQRRLDPMEKAIFGGCHLTRNIPQLLTDAGFVIKELDQFYQAATPKPMGALSVGYAVAS
ncbi:class I SAM-dependent methyltransferase [Antrihabitans stalactiti]|uniref:Class I SAM-dependent methyltransferase n=1 Tax=Antrihabitans stalactiti TaxID=2584121 RepID=A0A848KRW4_9NOCA|nr:class I SAM-dependent methyltransferase [Antrihabitans stalactiti]NMN98327.1 class I SAM-dependent methyltransferase [Antrihabitans stalactiti]